MEWSKSGNIDINKLFTSCTFVKCMTVINFEINYFYCGVNSKIDFWYCCFMQNCSSLRLRCILDVKSLLPRSSKINCVILFLYNFIQIKSFIWKEKELQKNQKWAKTIVAYFTFILPWKINYGIWSWLLNFFKANKPQYTTVWSHFSFQLGVLLTVNIIQIYNLDHSVLPLFLSVFKKLNYKTL